MTDKSGKSDQSPRCGSKSAPPPAPGGRAYSPISELVSHFDSMIDNCLSYAHKSRREGKPLVGIMCEYTPRELILAAGAIPVCLCGGSAEMIAPAEEQLPANLCPLIKSTFGYHLTKANPFLEMADLLVAETTCDGKKKMYELMGQSRPMYVLELPQKSDDLDARSHWQGQVLKLKAFLEERYAVEITADRLHKAITLVNRYRRLRRQLAESMERTDPPLTGRQLLDLKSIIWCMPTDMERYEAILPALQSVPPRNDLAGRNRVLLTGVPVVHGAEKVVDCIESSGGLVVCMENCTGLKPLLEDVDESRDNPIDSLASKYYRIPCSVMTPNDRRLESLAALARRYRADCVIDLGWQACLTYDIESARVKRLVEEELNLPYLKISTDYSPNDSARISLRVEAMFEMIKARPGGCG